MDGLIDTLASGVGNGIGWLADHGVLFGIFAILWAAFAVGLVRSQGSLDQAWAALQALPLLVQVVVWVALLPVVAGLWVWETSWPLIVRLALVLGLGGWNLLILLPKALQSAKP